MLQETQIRTLGLVVIDDNSDDRALVIRQIERDLPQAQVTPVAGPEDLAALLDDGSFDAVITDYQLHWSDGLSVLRAVRERYPERPVIMFTNTGTEEIAVEAMKTGLDDYIVKSRRNFVRLPGALLAALRRSWDRQRAAALETRLQALLNRLNVGVYEAPPGGPLGGANPALLRLLGAATHEALAALDLRELTAPPAATGSAESREIELRRADGAKIWVALSQSVRGHGQAARIDGLVEDITARKRDEAALAALNASLEARVRERTADLEAANADLEAFAAMAAHDLREPLRAIQGFAEAVLEDEGHGLQERSRLYLRRTLAVAAEMDDLVADLLEYSRLGRAALQRQPLRLANVLDEVLAQLRAPLAARRAQVQIGAMLIDVDAEWRTLGQILTNLITNAVTYVPAGKAPEVRIWAETDGTTARVWVADNGIGIAPADQARVFDIFTRLHGEESYPGTGVGLAIVRRGVERMGGQVGVESELGQGSRFWIALPVAAD